MSDPGAADPRRGRESRDEAPSAEDRPRVRLAAVSDGPIAVGDLHEAVRDPRCGAIVTYEGTPREIAALDYEAYVPMAERVLLELAGEVAARHDCRAVALVHRVGLVPAGEPSVVVSASAPHRAAAFAACRELLDAVTSRAPIWKTEVAADGARTPACGALPPLSEVTGDGLEPGAARGPGPRC